MPNDAAVLTCRTHTMAFLRQRGKVRPPRITRLGGYGAHLSGLIRSRSGDFPLSSALSLDQALALLQMPGAQLAITQPLTHRGVHLQVHPSNCIYL